VPTVDVKLVDVVKQFGEAVVVDHIDLEVRAGEFFSLLGPSGCGKTTTLRMIGGFEAPTSGVIELQGQDVTWLPPYKRNVNTVFQNYALFPHLTIYENVAFGLRRKGAKDSEVKSRVKEMLALVELPGYDSRKPNQISGGQAQRVALCRALLTSPRVVFGDEPTGNLDHASARLVWDALRDHARDGATVVIATHDEQLAAEADHRLVLA
jgi:spermidine/putrescine transport system ATP-binding protein